MPDSLPGDAAPQRGQRERPEHDLVPRTSDRIDRAQRQAERNRPGEPRHSGNAKTLRG